MEENEVYSNEHGSPQFVAFLAALTDIIPLRGHTGFRAGLDVKVSESMCVWLDVQLCYLSSLFLLDLF